MSFLRYMMEQAQPAVEEKKSFDVNTLKEACLTILSAIDEGELEFGDTEKIERPDSEGFAAAVSAEDDFVQAPDVADGYNAAEENLNDMVDDDLDESFLEDGFDDSIVDLATIPATNEESDQFSTPEEDNVSDEEAKKADFSDAELAESFTGWSDLD